MAKLSYMGICGTFVLLALSNADQVYSSYTPLTNYTFVNQQGEDESDADSSLVEKGGWYRRGEQGKRGYEGERGHRGERGEKGERGPRGHQGPIGPQGAVGPLLGHREV